MHLARGQTALAAARLHRRLNELGRDTLLAAPLLSQLVDVQIAQGDLAGANDTALALAASGRALGPGAVRRDGRAGLGVGGRGARRRAQATRHLDRAIELFTRYHMPLHAARAHLALARGVASRTRIEPSPRPARRSRRSNGSARGRDADAAAGFLRGLGVGGRTGPKLVGELSKREVEVLRLLGYGLTNAEIAVRLFISTKTVATHVGNIFAKLHVRNRAEAATFAQRYLTDDARLRTRRRAKSVILPILRARPRSMLAPVRRRHP